MQVSRPKERVASERARPLARCSRRPSSVPSGSREEPKVRLCAPPLREEGKNNFHFQFVSFISIGFGARARLSAWLEHLN